MTFSIPEIQHCSHNRRIRRVSRKEAKFPRFRATVEGNSLQLQTEEREREWESERGVRNFAKPIQISREIPPWNYARNPTKRNNPLPFRRIARIDNHIQLSFLIPVHLIIPRTRSFHFIDIRISILHSICILFLSNKITANIDRL